MSKYNARFEDDSIIEQIDYSQIEHVNIDQTPAPDTYEAIYAADAVMAEEFEQACIRG